MVTVGAMVLGADVVSGLPGYESVSPQEFAAAIKSDVARMGKVIKEAGIREE